MCPKKKNPLFLLFLIFFLSRSIFAPAQNVSFDSSSVPQDSLLTVSLQAGIEPKDKITPEDSSQVVESHDGHRQVLLDTNAFKPRFTLMKLLRGLLGMFFLIFLAYIFSSNRKAISWKVVGTGLALQLLLAIGILQVPFIQAIFEYAGKIFVKILDFTNYGTQFLFKSMSTGKIEPPLVTFAITILPTVIFFSALTSILLRHHTKSGLCFRLGNDKVNEIVGG